MSKLSKLLQEYLDKFDENFPTFLVMGIGDERMIELLEKAIKTNTKYEPELIEGAIY